jgi:two-component system, NarL family, invasion response regulator UvrY
MKLLIVDDHPIVRAGLRRLLSAEPQFEIVEAASGHEALALFREHRPGVVILDLNLPGFSGLEVLARLHSESPKARVLVLSMHDSPIYVTRALEAGASGYVSKNLPPEQLIDAVRRVAAGQPYIEHEIAQELALWNVRGPAQPLRQLSPRDVEILRLLAEGGSLTEIAHALGVSYKTIANHCTQLKARLATPRTADLIRFAIASGLAKEADGALLPTQPD